MHGGECSWKEPAPHGVGLEYLGAGGEGAGRGEERGGGRSLIKSPMMIERAPSAGASVQGLVFRISGLGFRFSVFAFLSMSVVPCTRVAVDVGVRGRGREGTRGGEGGGERDIQGHIRCRALRV
jgi:hypothetical protein